MLSAVRNSGGFAYLKVVLPGFAKMRRTPKERVSTNMHFTVETAGDSAVNLVVSSKISRQTSADVARLAAAVRSQQVPGITDIVPTYCSVMVCYDPLTLTFDELEQNLPCLAQSEGAANESASKLVEIPVAYGGVFGPDLTDVASLAGISPDEVIRIHSGVDYPVAMLGFLPGFPYLSGLDARIHTPRLDTPRTAIPRGSVGIGGQQTGIYPLESPGGWRLIGRTPLLLFDAGGVREIPYAAGDIIRFVPISETEFYRIAAEEGTDISDLANAGSNYSSNGEGGDARGASTASAASTASPKREPLPRARYSISQATS